MEEKIGSHGADRRRLIVAAATAGVVVLDGAQRVEGAESPARSTTAVARDWISVKDFGATGDGTTDDTAAIQSAVASLPKGGLVYFPPGDYLLTDSIRPVTGMTLMGSGYGSRIMCPDAGWSLNGYTFQNFGLINVKGKDKVRITGLRLYGTKNAVSMKSPKLIFIDTVDGLTIDHNWLEHMQFEGIWSGGRAATNRGVIVDSNHVEDVGFPAGAFRGLPAIQPNCEEMVISNNRLYNVGSGIGPGGRNITITGNFIRGVTANGIAVGDGDASGPVTIIGNVIEITADPKISRYGIRLDGGRGPNGVVTCIGNTIRVIGEASNITGRGIYATSAENVHIVGNTVEIEKRGIGIEVLGTVPGTTAHIENNTIRVVAEAGASIGIYAKSNGAGKTLTVRSANNRVYGVSVAHRSFAFNYNNSAGGTINATIMGDFSDGGHTRVHDWQYGDAGSALSVGGSPLWDDTSAAKNSQYVRSMKVGCIALEAPVRLTIAAGTVTIGGAAGSAYQRRSRITIDTERGRATDALDSIAGGQEGDIVVVSTSSSARTVVAKDNTGNMKLAGDFAMDSAADRLMLHLEGGVWYELSRSRNGD